MQYNMVVVVDLKLDEKEAQDKITTLLEKEGFRVSDVERLGKKILAYPIKKHTEGFYFSLQLASDIANPNTLNLKMKQDESILRYLVLRKEAEKNPKSKIQNPN